MMFRLISFISAILLIAFPVIQSAVTEHTIRNVQLPYNEKFPEEMKAGMLIILDGLAKSNPDRFALDLIHDYYNRFDRRDVVFHLNPRFRQQSVVRNTRINGHWGPEERERNLMPIKPNERFEIAVLVTSKAYRVFINGKHFTDYKHRLALSSVTHLGLWGDIHVNKVQIRYNPEFATINNILPFMKSFNENLIGDIYSKKMSGKMIETLKRGGKKNIHLHLDLSLEDPRKKFMKNSAKPNLKIDANIPVNKK